MKDEALKLALEALQEPLGFTGSREIDAKLREAITAIKQALAAPVQPMAHIVGEIDHTGKVWKPVQPAPVQPVAWVDSVMEQAQVFASAWSLVGGRFDSGNGLEDAKQAKAELRAMLTTPPAAQPAPVQPVSGVVLRDGYPTLIQDKHIKETDQRLCILPTTPPAAQRQWVGLTDEDYINIGISPSLISWQYKAIEAKLKEKNT
jgi:hypothetical protein